MHRRLGDQQPGGRAVLTVDLDERFRGAGHLEDLEALRRHHERLVGRPLAVDGVEVHGLAERCLAGPLDGHLENCGGTPAARVDRLEHGLVAVGDEELVELHVAVRHLGEHVTQGVDLVVVRGEPLQQVFLLGVAGQRLERQTDGTSECEQGRGGRACVER